MPTESRLRVAQALHSVFGQGSRIPDAWDAELSSEDAPFAQALLGLCLRRWGRLQAFIQPRLADASRGLPLGSQVVLAMGFAQVAWLPGVSDHAAVNEAVELAGDRTLGFPPHKGLVNALLRAGTRARDHVRAELDALPGSLDRTPFAERVLREALVAHHPEQEPKRGLEELWARLQEPPQASFRALKNEPMPEGLEADPQLPGAWSLGPGASFPRAWLASGAGMVQDRSSQALMDFRWERPVERIADLCAAPGGKTTSLALRWPKAELVAVEQHPRRARRLEENLRLRNVQARIVVEEAAAWLKKSNRTFDLILLDAPCSGSGTLRKHPELVWLGDGLDLQRLKAVQASLLEAAVGSLAPGGLLIYSVCSWLPEEGRDLLMRILEATRDLEPWPAWVLGNGGPCSSAFSRDPLAWDGEGFQAFALTRHLSADSQPAN